MPRSQQAIFSFASGVMTPRMALRADLPSYAQALRDGRNFFLTPQGGIIMRRGYQRVAELPENVRLFRFHRGGDKSDLVVQVETNAVVLLEDEAEIARFDNFFGGPAENLYFFNSERVGVLLSPDQPPYYIKITEQGNYKGEHLPFERVPQLVYNDDKSPQVAGSEALYTITVPTVGDTKWFAGMRFAVVYGNDIANEGFELPKEYWPAWSTTDGGGMTAAERNAQSIANGIKGTVHMLSDASQVTPTANSLGSYTMLVQGPGAGKTLEIRPVQAQGVEPAIVEQTAGEFTEGEEPAWSFPNVVTYNGLYYECVKPHYSQDLGESEPNRPNLAGSEEFWLLLDAKPEWFDYQYPDGNEWASDIAYGPWGRGWPQVGAIFQQRLILAALDDQPTSIYGSRIGDYVDFQLGVNASDPFYFDLDTLDSPKIKWIEATQSALILGTSAGDFRVSSEITLGPADIQVTKQNSARSYKTRAVSAHNTAFYIEQGRTKVRATRYGRERNSWTSEEVSLAAEHLFYGKVKRLAIIRQPEEVIFLMRDNGDLLAMHRMTTPDGFMASWSEMSTGEGVRIVDVCGYFSITDEEDRLVVVAQDVGTGNYCRMVMPYPARQFQTAADGGATLSEQGIVHLDSWIRPVAVSVEEGIYDVSPLEGSCVVLADDAYQGELEIVDGKVLLPRPVSAGAYLVAGYPYIARCEPFEFAAGNPRGVGFGTKRRWNRLYVRTLDSAAPLINGVAVADRAPATAMGSPDLIRHGLAELKVSAQGYSEGSFVIMQDRPYPTHVLGVYGEITVENA